MIKKYITDIDRHDDPYRKGRILAWVGGMVALLLLWKSIYEAPSWPYVLFGLLVTFLFYVIVRAPVSKNTAERLAQMMETRVGESYCKYAAHFKMHGINPKILRAVYNHLQWYLPDKFPVLPHDHLFKDYGLLKVDMPEIMLLVADLADRSLEECEENPYYKNLSTVENLVYFLHEQPVKDSTVIPFSKIH